jgi:hypothetical protein
VLPAQRATLADLLGAIDRAIVDGDPHRARRLVAEALDRCEDKSTSGGFREG